MTSLTVDIDTSSFFKTHYRIVRDDYCGYEVQHRHWWWPFWTETNYSNTFSTVESAEEYARRHASRQRPVKYLGAL